MCKDIQSNPSTESTSYKELAAKVAEAMNVDELAKVLEKHGLM